MDLKYCCIHFEGLHRTERCRGLNIRIIKLKDFENKSMDLKKPYRYWVTEGIELGQRGVKSTLIQFCPFCGINLSKFYKLDEYINEEDNYFMMPPTWFPPIVWP